MRVLRTATTAEHAPLASGLIAGEAVVAVIVPLLVVTGRLHP